MGWRVGSLLVVALVVVGCPSDDEPDGASEAGQGAADTDGGLPVVPCPDDLPEFAVGLEAVGDQGVYKAVIRDALPSPPERYFNHWAVAIETPDGDPVEDADLYEVQPFMPVHGHDGREVPVVEPMDDPGEFDVDRINLWMRGPWEVRFRARGAAGEDYMVFNVCIEG